MDVELSAAPHELTCEPLIRLGEGIGKVVYASPHWVVKRQRSPYEIIALIYVWKLLRRLEGILPGNLGRRLLEHPSRQIRLLRLLAQAAMSVVPRGIWHTRHIGAAWKKYWRRDRRGERLAQLHLSGTALVPERIEFPPTRVRVGGWPGWLTVSEATERVEATLYQRLTVLAEQGRYDEVEVWLNRFLDLRRAGWSHGIFSVDAHLKNFGVTGNRVVLLDPGGLTDRWHEVEARLRQGHGDQPHVHLGLGPILENYPELAARFDAQWKATVNPAEVRKHWPD